LPPQHFNCRSTTVPVIDYKRLGIPEPEEDQRASATGLVPENMTYGQWLAGQSEAVKIRTLGASRVPYYEKLRRKYGDTDAIRRFVREDGSELTLDQLKSLTR